MIKDKKISKTYSAAYKGNRGAFELAQEPKFCRRTKHITTKYHYFCNAEAKQQIKIFSIDAKNQQVDACTKPLLK